MKKTLVLGASDNPMRYSYKAIASLLRNGHAVIAVGNKNSSVMGLTITKDFPEKGSVHTVTLYLNPRNQRPYYEAIINLQPQRILFNPGAENPELEQLAEDAGIQTMEACTLVLLATGQY